MEVNDYYGTTACPKCGNNQRKAVVGFPSRRTTLHCDEGCGHTAPGVKCGQHWQDAPVQPA